MPPAQVPNDNDAPACHDAHTARAGLARISKQWGLQGFFESVIFVFNRSKHTKQIFKRLGKILGKV